MVTSQFDYYNSMLINKVDSAGNPLPLGGAFPLEENEHFNKLPVSTQMSNIQVPTNVYNRGMRSETKRTEPSYVCEHTILFLFLWIWIEKQNSIHDNNLGPSFYIYCETWLVRGI